MVLVVKNPPASAGDIIDKGSIPGSGKIPWRRKWQPTPVFLPAEFHGQGTWWAALHGVIKSWTPLKQLSTCSYSVKLSRSFQLGYIL